MRVGANAHVVLSVYDRDVAALAARIEAELGAEVLRYHKERPGEPYNVPVNRGNEASAYLKYVLDHWGRLPAVACLCHDEDRSWHHRGSLVDRLREGIAAVGASGFHNVNDFVMGDVTRNALYPQITAWWRALCAGHVPNMARFPRDWTSGYLGCAQLVVTRDRIERYPREFYGALYDWLLATPLDSSVSGRFLEWTWHVIWGEPGEARGPPPPNVAPVLAAPRSAAPPAPAPSPTPPPTPPAPAWAPPKHVRFFVSRHVSASSPPHVVALAARCVESIRRVYASAQVTVVEDRVPAALSFAPPDARVRVVANAFPGSGELGTAFAASRSDPDDAAPMVLVHDSMVVLAPVPADPGPGGVRALWEFNRYHFHHMPELLAMLARAVPARAGAEAGAFAARYERVLDLLRAYAAGAGAWTGCFGLAVVATRAGLRALADAFGFLDAALLAAVDTREKRQAMERVVGIAISLRGAPPPVCGDIFEHPDPWATVSAHMTLAEMRAYAARAAYDRPLAKSWVGR